MKWNDRFRFVRQNMGKNKSRIFMTVLATAMGCAFLIMIASVGFGLQKSIVDEYTQDRAVTEIQVHSKMGENGSYVAVSKDDVAFLSSIKHVKAITTKTRIPEAKLTLDTYSGQVAAIITNFEQEAKSGLELQEGRLPESPSEAIIGYHLGQSLVDSAAEEAYAGSLLGKQVVIDAYEYAPDEEGNYTRNEGISQALTIVGVLPPPDREWQQDARILLDDALLPVLLPRHTETDSEGGFEITVFANSAKQVTSISKEMRAAGYQLYSVADTIKEMDLVFLVMKIGLLFVGTIAVLIASIGIYNTMTMAVTERAQDIGIMKAIGAHPRTIRSIFLIESTGIGLLGALIGTLAAYGISILANAVVPLIIQSALEAKAPEQFQISYIPVSLTLISIGISLFVAILSGLRPAKRATRIDVLRALRRDL